MPRSEHFPVVALTTTIINVFRKKREEYLAFRIFLSFLKSFLTFEIKVAIIKMKQGHADQNNKTFHPYLGMMYIAERTSKHVPIDQKI